MSTPTSTYVQGLCVLPTDGIVAEVDNFFDTEPQLDVVHKEANNPSTNTHFQRSRCMKNHLAGAGYFTGGTEGRLGSG